MVQIISREPTIDDLIKSWILANVRQQKSIRKAISSYPMKGLVERDIGRYITEKQFVDAMIQLGFETDGQGHFNSILVSKWHPEKDKEISRPWGFNKSSIARWKKSMM